MSHSPNNRRLSRQQRSEAIVDAALEVFATRGYRGATTRRLADVAGITEVTLFRHFPSKEALFGAVIDKYSVLPLLRNELDKLDNSADAREVLHNLAGRMVGVLRARKSMIRLFLAEAVSGSEQGKAIVRQAPARVISDMSRLLASFRERGEIRDIDPTLGARAFLGVLLSFVVFREILFAQGSEESGPEQAVRELADILCNGLCPANPDEKRGSES